MRVAAILGLGVSSSNLELFRTQPTDSWQSSLPSCQSDADAILIFGGDGTIHRILGQLVQLKLPVLVVPCGSGNDFARALGLASRSIALTAWKRFCAGKNNVKTIDLGTITAAGSPGLQEKHYFCCIAGAGLDSEVAARANRLPRWLRGHGGYAFSLPRALARFKSIPMRISADRSSGGAMQLTTLAAFANTSSYGGAMKIAPHALFDDGQLDLCVIRKMNKLKLCAMFPTIYSGRHLEISGVEYARAENFVLESDPPVAIYADGEYLCNTPIIAGVAPAALQVIVP